MTPSYLMTNLVSSWHGSLSSWLFIHSYLPLLPHVHYHHLVTVNTFHAYSFAEKRWSPVLPSAGSAGPPSPRDRHVAFAYGNSIFIQGGFDGTSRISDFWSFDLSAMSWREVVGTGRAPSPRHSHSAVVYRHSVFLYGGYDGSYKSDLHEFDFDTNQWNLVPTTGRRPRARYRATTVVHKDYMILYGGHEYVPQILVLFYLTFADRARFCLSLTNLVLCCHCFVSFQLFLQIIIIVGHVICQILMFLTLKPGLGRR